MIFRLAIFFLGRQFTWRLGRALYLFARGDVANNISTNGEIMVQRCVVDAWRLSAKGNEKLVVFDVGANVGDWSEEILKYITLPRERMQLDLHLFEPVPSTFEMLKSRLKNIGMDVTLNLHQIALSSSLGTENMTIIEGSGINSLHFDNSSSKTASISIQKDTVENFCDTNSIDEIKLLKCDTEGHDMEVIKGALPLLTNSRIKVLQFEYNHRWVYSRHYLKDVFDVIEQLPFKLGKIQSDHIEIYAAWHPELERFFEANFLLIHNDALKWFNTTTAAVDKYNTFSTTTL